MSPLHLFVNSSKKRYERLKTNLFIEGILISGLELSHIRHFTDNERYQNEQVVLRATLLSIVAILVSDSTTKFRKFFKLTGIGPNPTTGQTESKLIFTARPSVSTDMEKIKVIALYDKKTGKRYYPW